MQLNIGKYVGWSVADLRANGVADTEIGAAIKAHAKHQIAEFADGYRARLSAVSAGKLAEYRIKEAIASAPDAASDTERALLEREATARGLEFAALLAQIETRARAYRHVSLLIGALEAEAAAAIAAVPADAPDIEAQVARLLRAAQDQADAAFGEAQTLMQSANA